MFAVFARRSRSFAGVIALACLFAAACSMPTLQPQECTDARVTVKQFYSFHFGNEMRPSPENLKLREKFLTPELARELEAAPPTETDYFTATDHYPKAFKDAGCTLESPDRAIFRVNLFWREDERNVQKELDVETVKRGDQWLINKVSPK